MRNKARFTYDIRIRLENIRRRGMINYPAFAFNDTQPRKATEPHLTLMHC